MINRIIKNKPKLSMNKIIKISLRSFLEKVFILFLL